MARAVIAMIVLFATITPFALTIAVAMSTAVGGKRRARAQRYRRCGN